MRAVAERFVRRMAAAAKRYGRAPSEAERRPLRIDDFKIALDADGTVAVDGNLGCGHFSPREQSMPSSTDQEQAEMKRSPRRRTPFDTGRSQRLILWNGRIHFIGPREDSALHVDHFAETGFAQKVHGLGRALAAAAMRDDFARGIEFVHAPRQFAQRNQMSFQVADLVFVRLAHIEDKKIIAVVETRLQFAWSDFRDLNIRGGSFFAAHAAKFIVVDELVNRAIRTAHRTLGIFTQFEFTEAHSQRVKQEQASNEIVAAAENQFDGLHGLNGPDDPGQNAKHSAFCARRHKPRRRRFGIEAAVARAIGHAENGGLPFETENRTVDVRLAEQNASVVDQVASREIVRAIHDDVVVLEELKRVRAGQLRFDGFDLNVRIEIRKARARSLAFGLAHVAGAKSDLALKIGEIHNVEVNQAQLAHAGGGKIQAEWCAESAGSNKQHLGVFQLELPLHANFRHDEMAAITKNLFF